jgi:nucleoside-diphosphate-sugar epimerase
LDRFADGGGPIRSYVCAQTLAEVFLAVAEHPENTPPIINVAEAGPVAMSEIAVAAGRPVSWRQAPEGALQRAVLATDRLARLMALDPERATAGGIVADWKSWQGAFP